MSNNDRPNRKGKEGKELIVDQLLGKKGFAGENSDPKLTPSRSAEREKSSCSRVTPRALHEASQNREPRRSIAPGLAKALTPEVPKYPMRNQTPSHPSARRHTIGGAIKDNSVEISALPSSSTISSYLHQNVPGEEPSKQTPKPRPSLKGPKSVQKRAGEIEDKKGNVEEEKVDGMVANTSVDFDEPNRQIEKAPKVRRSQINEKEIREEPKQQEAPPRASPSPGPAAPRQPQGHSLMVLADAAAGMDPPTPKAPQKAKEEPAQSEVQGPIKVLTKAAVKAFPQSSDVEHSATSSVQMGSPSSLAAPKRHSDRFMELVTGKKVPTSENPADLDKQDMYRSPLAQSTVASTVSPASKAPRSSTELSHKSDVIRKTPTSFPAHTRSSPNVVRRYVYKKRETGRPAALPRETVKGAPTTVRSSVPSDQQKTDRILPPGSFPMKASAPPASTAPGMPRNQTEPILHKPTPIYAHVPYPPPGPSLAPLGATAPVQLRETPEHPIGVPPGSARAPPSTSPLDQLAAVSNQPVNSPLSTLAYTMDTQPIENRKRTLQKDEETQGGTSRKQRTTDWPHQMPPTPGNVINPPMPSSSNANFPADFTTPGMPAGPSEPPKMNLPGPSMPPPNGPHAPLPMHPMLPPLVNAILLIQQHMGVPMRTNEPPRPTVERNPNIVERLQEPPMKEIEKEKKVDLKALMKEKLEASRASRPHSHLLGTMITDKLVGMEFQDKKAYESFSNDLFEVLIKHRCV